MTSDLEQRKTHCKMSPYCICSMTYVFLVSSMWAVSSLCWAIIPLKMSTISLKSGILVTSFPTRISDIISADCDYGIDHLL